MIANKNKQHKRQVEKNNKSRSKSPLKKLWDNFVNFFEENDKEKIKKRIIEMPSNQEFSFTNQEINKEGRVRRTETPKFQKKDRRKKNLSVIDLRSKTAPIHKKKKFMASLSKGRFKKKIENIEGQDFSFEVNEIEEWNVGDEEISDQLSKKIGGFQASAGILSNRRGTGIGYGFPSFVKKNSFNKDKSRLNLSILGGDSIRKRKLEDIHTGFGSPLKMTGNKQEESIFSPSDGNQSTNLKTSTCPSFKRGNNREFFPSKISQNHKKSKLTNAAKNIFFSDPTGFNKGPKTTKGLDFSRSKKSSTKEICYSEKKLHKKP